jgi:hypothetical protein
VVGASLPSLRVTRVLEGLALVRGAPAALRVDYVDAFPIVR